MMRFCPECGKDVRVQYEGPFRRYVCTSCKAVQYDNPRPCVTALIVRGGQILFSKRSIEPGKGKWDLVGGFMEAGEHPLKTLQREVSEELGVGIEEAELLGFFPDVYGEGGATVLNIAYVCRIDGEPRTRSDEFDEIGWFPLSDLPEDCAFGSIPDMLREYASSQEGGDLQEWG